MSDSDSCVEMDTLTDLLARLKVVEQKLEELTGLQKQDADETVGSIGTLMQTVDEMEETVEKIENQVEHHQHLFERYRIEATFNCK